MLPCCTYPRVLGEGAGRGDDNEAVVQ
jgi:hypothetical protein